LLAAEAKPTANHKHVFRIRKWQGLRLQRHSGRRKGRLHDGKVVVMRSNLRWCSDVFEITCWNGDIVRIVFVIDAHDREVLAWHTAAGTGISASMVRDLMLETVELRFGTVQAPHAVEWLSDNGSPFTARETLDFAAALGLMPCFAPVQGPE
jgi:putative transposase